MWLTDCAVAGITLTCYFEAYVRTHVFEAAGMNVTGYLPPKERWAFAAPTWHDNYYRHRTMQGQVSDENSYALGGIAGHAGVFRSVALAGLCASCRLLGIVDLWSSRRVCGVSGSTAPQIMMLMQKLMFATPTSTFLNSTTVKLFTTAHNLTQSSRALGWDTNSWTMNTCVIGTSPQRCGKRLTVHVV